MPLNGEAFTGPLPKPQSRAAEKKKQDRATERAWLLLRKIVLERDRYRCRCCGTPEKVDVHHVKFRSAGGEDSTKNCAALCRICHLEIHAYRLHVEGVDANKRLRFVWSK